MCLDSLHSVDHFISDDELIIPLCVLCSWNWPTVYDQLYLIMSHHICMQYNTVRCICDSIFLHLLTTINYYNYIIVYTSYVLKQINQYFFYAWWLWIKLFVVPFKFPKNSGILFSIYVSLRYRFIQMTKQIVDVQIFAFDIFPS